MSTDLINRVLRFGEGRAMKQMQSVVSQVNDREAEFQARSDDELRAFATGLMERGANGEPLDDLMVEAFALAREVGQRKMGMRLYDVQLIGAQVLHSGKIAEMKTGEGKTFAAVPAVYLNALAGRGVHVVTVNDYLARRDADWMRPVYAELGLDIGVIDAAMQPADRRAAYAAHATYGTNSEFGFDYLRDNMAVQKAETVQRDHFFCIVDEVDSILIDEARTPLIISGIPEAAADTYYRFARIIPTLRKGVDFEVDEKHRTVAPTESGVEKVERALGIDNLYLDVNGQLVNHLIQALKAHALFHNNKEYLVRDGEVLIVDEFTGRVLEGRRYSEGLHQAIEAKEGQKIREENQTLATITLQNYFRMYDKLSGMTGTASTEANEFAKIYETDVVSIPTHRPTKRRDEQDFIFKTRDSKFNAVAKEITEAHENGQPVLVGTISVEVSEQLSNHLTRSGIQHNVLNAKNHEREAEIIKNAGERGAVTIATNMAGRGVDIKLGEGVPELGGLLVIGTERHESRRIDNQLRGRSGRQGDPGRSRFFISAEDDLIRVFAGDRIYKILDRLGPGDDLPIESKMLTRTIEGAQKKVEEMNFNVRKRVLEYDDVLNKQREVIYRERRAVLDGRDLAEQARDWVAEVLVDQVEQAAPDDETLPADWDLDSLFATLRTYYPVGFGPAELPLHDPSDPFTREDFLNMLEDDAMDAYDRKEAEFGVERMREWERYVLLQLVDVHWREHLYSMDYLREGIHLRALGQKDPLSEYRLEGHSMFDETMSLIKDDFVRYMFHIEAAESPELESTQPETVDYTYDDQPVHGFHADEAQMAATQVVEAPADEAPAEEAPVVEQRIVTDEERIGRNDPCWCGSGKKYKKCHGANA
ncbi:MAG: preprotein translocase subunit SecA [Thermoleophilia bacterium]